MKIIETPVFTISELSGKSKERARNWYRETIRSSDFDEGVIHDAKTAFSFCGLSIIEVFYSGFWNQGDGACFEGSWSAQKVQSGKLKDYAPQDKELHAIAEEFERIAKQFPFASFSVKHSGRYSHEFCTDFIVSIEDENGDEIRGDEADAAETALIEAARSAMRWIYAQLKGEYEFQHSDEVVDETLDANEYTFTADGERFG